LDPDQHDQRGDAWTISARALKVSADGALGNSSGGLTLDGGTLRWRAVFNLSLLRTVTLGSSGGTFDTNGFDTAISQGITGTGGLTKNGSSTLMLGAPNSYTGRTTVNAGTLQAAWP
jgi:fibronectin-binding autotransporter adhesin